jgi:hypothetical protein
MRSLPVGDKNIKAFHAHLYDTPGILTKLGGTIYFCGDDDSLIEYEPDMANFCAVLGEVGLAETQKVMDTIVHHGYAAIACSRDEGRQ